MKNRETIASVKSLNLKEFSHYESTYASLLLDCVYSSLRVAYMVIYGISQN